MPQGRSMSYQEFGTHFRAEMDEVDAEYSPTGMVNNNSFENEHKLDSTTVTTGWSFPNVPPRSASPCRSAMLRAEWNSKKGSSNDTPSEISKPIVAEPVDNCYFVSTQRPALWHKFERQLKEAVGCAAETWRHLIQVEAFFGYPGSIKIEQLVDLIDDADQEEKAPAQLEDEVAEIADRLCKTHRGSQKLNFDVMVFASEASLRRRPASPLRTEFAGTSRHFVHDLQKENKESTKLQAAVFSVYSFAEVLIALLVNPFIQSVVLCDNYIDTDHYEGDLEDEVLAYRQLVKRWVNKAKTVPSSERIGTLVAAIKSIRMEVDIFVVTERTIEDGMLFAHVRRSFFPTEDYFAELYSAIIGGVQARQRTPFFSALSNYAARPIGVFHALAISRGSSLIKSRWLGDFVDFYGLQIFRAESSSTCGGLDSLLDPTGSLKEAQQLASQAFGSTGTYFVTNGTSTANKIVIQALVCPGDIVLVDRDCHKSHHYGLVHAGAWPCYLDAYPLHEYLMYGGVSLSEIKSRLLAYKRCGMLHRVRMVILTNCTFDGIVYNVARVMEECLAIKPDLVFLWDEAWFAYASFNPVLRRRTGMGAARLLARMFKSKQYIEECEAFWAQHKALMDSVDEDDHAKLLQMRLMPKPAESVLRVYVTQSTHKSLTSFRQGSMIHIFDQRFRGCAEMPFLEAYYTHTSTSPNYQILASLDAGRSQMQLEGFEFVLEMLEHAMYLRRHAAESALVSKWLKFLDVADLIPAEFRRDSQCPGYWNERRQDWRRFEDAWMSDDEFVLDPTRLTLYTAATGLNGNEFKVDWLMNKCDIQINKTSRNSVLFQTNIGTTFSSVAYLLQSLRKISHDFEVQHEETGGHLSSMWQKSVARLKDDQAMLPDFTSFHPIFTTKGSLGNEGDMRRAFYLAYDENNCEYIPMDVAQKRIERGEALTATTFTIPYPPGFPVLVPGQLISLSVLDFMKKLDVKEIHGYAAEHGLRIFKPSVLNALKPHTMDFQ
uniref:Orn/Lys/Arg decarboxylases family 1 pyridoxal-P attachment site domain-containing protein n=1 Tax=Eutreptiella gymnastica TaxID=73025 RepID=A0A7S1IDK9_9EUGL